MNELAVIKIGGNVIESPNRLPNFLADFAQLGIPKILVHGGGKQVTALAEQMDIPVKMIAGRRITDAKNLDLITMLYGGKINKTIVAQLQRLDCNALGLSGADGNSIQAVKRPVKAIDYGYVGDIIQVNTDLFQTCLNSGLIPVCCAITHNKKGQLLNTNADTIAAEIAKALAPFFDVSLWYCFEIPGVLANLEDENSIIETLKPQNYALLKSQRVIHSGMIPKIDNSFDALRHGVSKVKMGLPEIIVKNTKHTTILLDDA